MEGLNNVSNKLIESVKTYFTRSLPKQIDWSQRLIEIRGSRGVGKTTLMLQRAKEMRASGAKVMYASLDAPYFFTNGLYDFAEKALQYGITHLFLDEVHRYPSKHKASDWSLELKNVHDAFPELCLVYSGSSILHLFKGKGDLSRRKATYLLPGLSFREYLEYRRILPAPRLSLEELLQNHADIAQRLAKQFKPILHFEEYLSHGYYPFYTGNETVYAQQLKDVIGLVIDLDLAEVASIAPSAKEQLKRLLGAISMTVPYVPNMHKLADLVGITDYRTLMKYLYLLEDAQLISLLQSAAKGNKTLQKPNKIYLNNSNLSHALSPNHFEIGTARETFFISQLREVAEIHYPKSGDFLVNQQYIFEVGGKGKGLSQIKEVTHAYIAADGIEVGFGRKIPLWLFGFLY